MIHIATLWLVSPGCNWTSQIEKVWLREVRWVCQGHTTINGRIAFHPRFPDLKFMIALVILIVLCKIYLCIKTQSSPNFFLYQLCSIFYLWLSLLGHKWRNRRRRVGRSGEQIRLVTMAPSDGGNSFKDFIDFLYDYGSDVN